MDVWGPARVRGQGHERYFLLVVDDYSRYTTVFPLRSKGDVTELNLQPRVSLPETSPTLRWTGKVGDASAFRVWGSRAFVRDLSTDKLSPRASPCVFLGFPPDAPGWQVFHPTSRRVLSSQDVTFDESVPYYRLFPYRTAPLPPPPLFLAPGPPPVDPLPPQGPAPSGVSQVDAVEPVEVAVDSGAATGAEPAGAGSGGAVPGGAEPGGAEFWGAEPGGAAFGGAEPGGTESGGAEPGGAVPGGAEPGGAEPGGAGSARVTSRGTSSRRELLSPQELREWFARRWCRAAGAGGPPPVRGSAGACPGGTGAAGPRGAAASVGVGPAGGSAGASGDSGVAGSPGTRAPGAPAARAAGSVATGVGAVGAGIAAGAGAPGGAGAAGPSGVGTAGAEGAAGAGAAPGGTGAVPVGSGSAERPRPYFVPLLEQVLGLPPSPSPVPPLDCPQPVESQSPLQPVSSLPAPSPYAGPTGGLAERREPASRPASPVRATRMSHRAPRLRPPAVPGTHQMTLRPSTAPLRVPLPSPPASSLPFLADPTSDSLRAASLTVARLLSTVVTDPSFESTAASALVAELVDFAARCRLDYAASLVAESASVCPPSVGDPDARDIPTPRSYAEAIEGPYSSQWQSAMDAEMSSWKSTGTYVDEVPPPGANIVSGMWIFRVKRPPGSPPVFKARYVARGFREPPRSPPVLYVDNKAMLALCREHRLEHRTKHIALRYFLARELQQRGQLRLAYVASEANTADIFTKALPPGDHQRFCTMLGPLAVPCSPRVASCFLCAAPCSLRTAFSQPVRSPPLRCLASARPACYTAMASLRVLAFDHEGRLIHFDTWLDDLQLYLLSDSRDNVSLFDHTSGAAPAPPATADSATRSQWLTCDAAARLAIRNHLSLAECAHFGQRRTAQALYDAVVARYSSPATAALGRLLRPYLFCELSAFATVEDLVSHLRTSDAHYRAALPAEFLAKNPPPMYITLYFIVTCVPDSLRAVRDHFLALDPTALTVDLLKQHLLAAETSVVAVGAARGTPHTPFFEGCSPSPLAPSYVSAAAADVPGAEDVGAASASAKRRSSKGKGARGGGDGSGAGGGGSSGGGGSDGSGGGSGCFGGGGGGSGGSGGSGSGGSGGGRTRAQRGGSEGGQRLQQQRQSETPSPQQLREWFAQRGASGGSGSCPYVIRTGDRAGQKCGKPHTQHRCFSRLDDAWRADFGDEAERPRWAELLRSGVAIFDLEYDAIIAAMYALSVSAEGDCYPCVPPDPGKAAAALGASKSVLPGTTPTEALHTFTLDSGTSRCFFRDSTTLTPLSAPLPVRLADPSGGPVLARSSTELPCPALNLWPCVSLPETSPTLRWTGKVGDASVFWVWGSRAFVRDTSAGKLSAHAIPCGPAPSGVSQVDPLPGTAPVEVAVGSGAAPGAASRGAASGGAVSRGAELGGAESEGAGSGGAEPGSEEPGGAEPEGVELGGAEPTRVEPGGAESEGAESRGAEPRGISSSGGPAGALPPAGAGESAAGDTGARGAGVTAGAGGTGGATAAAGAGDPTEPGAAGAGGAGAVGAGAGGTGAGGAGVLGVPSSTGLTPPLLCLPPDQSQPPLQLASPLRAPPPYTKQTGGLTEHCEPASRPSSPVCTSCRVPRPRPPPVPSTHTMALRPSSVPLRVPPPPPPECSLPAVPDPESERARAVSPTVSRLLATFVTDPSFESTAVSALVAELVDFAAACCLDYATAIVAKSESAGPLSVEGECALSTHVLEDIQDDFECLAAAVPRFASMLLAPEGDPDAPDILTPRSYVEVITGPYSSQWQAAMDAEMGSLHEEIWLRRPPAFTGSFPAGTQWSLRRLVYGLRHAPREWHDTLRTTLAALGFTPTADVLLFLRTDTSLPPFYVLVYVDNLVFTTADTEALTLVNSELQKRHTCTDLGELCSYLGLQITRDRALRTITLTQSHMVHQVLQHFGFQFSSPQPTSLFTGHSLLAPSLDESVEPSVPYPELVGCLMYMMTCTRPDLAYPLSLQAHYVARSRHRKVHWDAAKRVLRYLCSTLGMGLVLGGRGPILLIGHADASWVDDLATQRSSQGYTFSLDNKAMIALCQEHRLEHITKHIALRYFLAQDLQQRGQLRLAYVATRAKTADIFTKALPPGDHQRFSTVLGLVPTLPHLLTA
ncbi:unnamed protein product [Closterium sp. NIES-54]